MLARARVTMPYRLGPVRVRPSLLLVWHCRHFLKESWPLSALALGRRARTGAGSNGAAGSLETAATSVIGSAQPGFSAL